MVGQIIPCKTHGIICPTISQKGRTGYALPAISLILDVKLIVTNISNLRNNCKGYDFPQTLQVVTKKGERNQKLTEGSIEARARLRLRLKTRQNTSVVTC